VHTLTKKKKIYIYIYNILPQFVAPVRKVYSVSKAFSRSPRLHDMPTEKENISEYPVDSAACRTILKWSYTTGV
jgi:hypothetical protein